MAYANIIIRNIKPKNNSSAISLDSIISFDMIPTNGDEIDISTLEVKININGMHGNQNYTFNSSSPQVSYTGGSTTGYKLKIDMFPDSEYKFDESSFIKMSINVRNTSGDRAKPVSINYNSVSLDQLEALIDLLSEVMEVTVDRELGRFIDNGTTVSFTWDNWSVIEEPLIYKNDVLLTSGYAVNKQTGIVTFDVPLRTTDPVDRIEADYKHGVFTQSELINFMEIGLAEYNAQPRHSSWNLQNAPAQAQAAIIIGGAYWAICALLLGLINQQSRIRWGNEDNWDKVQSMLTTLKENYKSSVQKLFEAKKLVLAQPLGIVIPQYVLPGARSRFFRYLYKEGGSM